MHNAVWLCKPLWFQFITSNEGVAQFKIWNFKKLQKINDHEFLADLNWNKIEIV